jgi:pimeloyl-ACP methyl ester carboxylesterase
VPTVVRVHGLGGSSRLWGRVAPALAIRLDTEVLAVDLPGFGRSRAIDRRTTIAASSQVVQSLLEHVGPAHVIASSMGAAVAVHTAARAPGLVGSLVLVGAALPPPPGTLARPIPTRVWLAMVPGLGPLLAAHYGEALSPERLVDDRLATWCARPASVDPEIRRRMVEVAAERRAFPEDGRAYSEAAQSLALYLTVPGGIHDDLAAVDARVLLIHGTEDRLIHIEYARAFAAGRNGTALVALPDCGHVPHVECPRRFVAACLPHLLDEAQSATAG